MATDYSSKEQYKIQPENSVVIDMGSKKTKGERSTSLKIHDKELPIVNTATHLGIQRSSTVKDTLMDTINKNVTKTKRTCYRLRSAGLHGNNGRYPVTSLHLIIYSCFVNLRKAFDTLWHSGLLYKLLTNKVGCKFFNVIQNIYSLCQSAIKIDTKH